MSRDNQEERRSYNPVCPSYNFYGNNTNYNFLQPGTYDVKLNTMSGNQPENRNVHFHFANETNTNVMFPNSAILSVPASPARVQAHGGNQPGSMKMPQSPMQRGFSNGATASPGSPFANISSAETPNASQNSSFSSTYGEYLPRGATFSSISSSGW